MIQDLTAKAFFLQKHTFIGCIEALLAYDYCRPVYQCSMDEPHQL